MGCLQVVEESKVPGSLRLARTFHSLGVSEHPLVLSLVHYFCTRLPLQQAVFYLTLQGKSRSMRQCVRCKQQVCGSLLPTPSSFDDLVILYFVFECVHRQWKAISIHSRLELKPMSVHASSKSIATINSGSGAGLSHLSLIAPV